MGDRKVINVYLLGIGFMLIFTAFTTCGNIEQTVIRSLTNSSFSGSGYNSGYVVSFSKPMTWSFYITSIFIGFAAADHDRSTLFIVLFVISLAGTVILLALKNIKHLHHHSEINDPLLLDSRLLKEKEMSTLDQITSEFRSMLRLFCTKNMLLLSMPIAYSGLVLTFYSGVYGTCIGATRQFGTMAKGLIGLSGIFIGIGEILGGGVFGLLCINNQFRRTSAILLGVIVHFLAFYLIFLIIPGDAPKGGATSGRFEPYLSPSPSAALVSSFLLGLGDSCFNTQLYSILGILYPQQSGPAFAIFKFVQSISAAVAFGYSNYLVLSSQLLLLTTFCFIGTLSFFIVEKIEDNASGLQDF
ncbi:hypothetical protein chiPu_0014651 [Chiloscyllium punctatum]|uniref:UNC93-like protein MFSD11 n=1 Tax=Chiloscyllium punctatum TaxID=137246 RepID=A0A401T0I3_CHIPU|nr:hypothetical protein [Chiloscyllium punctatum]